MPSQAEHSIEKVDYGGLFLGTRQRKQEKPPKPSRKPRKKNLVSIVPDGEVDDGDTALLDPDTPTLLLGNRATNNAWHEEVNDEGGMACSEEQVELPTASDGWEVLTLNIDVHKKAMRSDSGCKSFSKRVSSLAANSCLSRERIDKLLGELIPATPLGTIASNELRNEQEAGALEADARAGTQQTVPTILSFSTFLFGASDVGNMSEIGSDFASTSRVPTLSEDFRMSTLTDRIPTLTDRIPTLTDLENGKLSPRFPVTRNSACQSSRGSDAFRQTSLDEIPSPTLLTGSNDFGNLPNSLHSLALDKVFNTAPETASAPNVEEQARHSRLYRADKASTIGSGGSILKKVEEKSEPQLDSCTIPATVIRARPLEIGSVGKIGSPEEQGVGLIVNSALMRRRQMKMSLASLCPTVERQDIVKQAPTMEIPVSVE
jgi:hypothetical protein